ncbi:MAG: ABC transporter substrate-binding protein, partial [Streptosporangiales bacterium]
MPQPAQGTTSLDLDRRSFLRGGLAAAGAGLVPSLLAGCGSSTAKTASGKDVVSVRFNWTLKGEFTPFFVAREKGYYDKENLEVKLGEGKSGTQAVQVVGTGKDDFGYIPSIQVAQGVNKGVPLKSIATMGRYTGMCWASWPDVPLDGPKSLLDRR